MNIEAWQLAVAPVVGAAIGVFYFGGLWLTVKRFPSSANPHLLLIGSFFLRMAVTLAAFYALTPWGWPAMATALAGMLITRQLMTHAKGKNPMTNKARFSSPLDP